MKKNILVLVGGYLPAKKYGGPVSSIYNLTELLCDYYNFYIVTLNHDLKSKDPFNVVDGWNVVGKANVKYLEDSKINIKNINKIIDEVKPSMIYLNSFFYGIFTLSIMFSRKYKKTPVLIAPRGEITRTSYHGHGMKKTIYIFMLRCLNKLKFPYYQSTSFDENTDVKNTLKISDEKMVFLPNVPSVGNTLVINNHKIKGSVKCIFVGRILKKKNLLYALNILSCLDGKVIFNIYGVIEDSFYWGKCQECIKKMGPNVQVNYCGSLDHGLIINKYAEHDVLFLPTEGENFGHSIVEAMQSKVVPIISDKTPWTSINDFNCGFAGDLNDPPSFKNYLQRIIDMDESEFFNIRNSCSNYIKNHLRTDDLKEKYIVSFRKIIGE